jgi:hypothetical protein
MKLNIKSGLLKIVFTMLLTGFVLTSCEDDVPNEYIMRKYVEAFLIVGEPIQGIKLMETQPLDKSFDLDAGWIKDASVIIISEGNTYNLAFGNSTPKGYYLPDNSVLVKPGVKYELEITLNDGTKITAETTTPNGNMQWVRPPKNEVYYPKDTTKLPGNDSLDLEWTGVQGTYFYILSVICQDTLEYGKYLTPSNPNEKNRRAFNNFVKDNNDYFLDIPSWNFIANTKTPTVWLAFKWFGPQRVTIYAPDYNFLRWFLQSTNFSGNESDPLKYSVNNAIGVFGSAIKLSADFFLYKNQP